MKQISLCITTYNRLAYLFKSFEQVVNDERIGEIVIVDDHSDIELFKKVEERCKYISKVKLFRNKKNLSVYDNKRESVKKAESEYCIVFDSDNVISKDFLDKIYSQKWRPDLILAPDFARPAFDYRRFAGITFKKENATKYTFKPLFSTLMNTMNYFVHRDSYLEVWKPKKDIKGADSIYFNYLWLKSGKEIHCLKGLNYYHRVHHEKNQIGSNYARFAHESAPQCNDIEKLMSLLNNKKIETTLPHSELS